MFGSGKDLKRQRLNSVMVGVQDHQAIIKDLQNLRNQNNLPTPVIPKIKGYGDGGNSRFNKQVEALPAIVEQSIPFAK
jgi:hypothetical protein